MHFNSNAKLDETLRTINKPTCKPGISKIFKLLMTRLRKADVRTIISVVMCSSYSDVQNWVHTTPYKRYSNNSVLSKRYSYGHIEWRSRNTRQASGIDINYYGFRTGISDLVMRFEIRVLSLTYYLTTSS